MQLTFTPIILACDAVKNACVSLVQGGFSPLVGEDVCKAMLEQALTEVRAENPAILFIGKCINWGAGV